VQSASEPNLESDTVNHHLGGVRRERDSRYLARRAHALFHEPLHPPNQHPRLAASGCGQYQRPWSGALHRGQLRGVEVGSIHVSTSIGCAQWSSPHPRRLPHFGHLLCVGPSLTSPHAAQRCT
jgi:hypothetical protein